jgi:hypothetical protein
MDVVFDVDLQISFNMCNIQIRDSTMKHNTFIREILETHTHTHHTHHTHHTTNNDLLPHLTPVETCATFVRALAL